jgi:ChrR-like protein with cupin domain
MNSRTTILLLNSRKLSFNHPAVASAGIVLTGRRVMTKKQLMLGLFLAVVAGFGYAADSGKTGTMIPADEMEWKELNPGSPVKMAPLWGDRSVGEYAMLLKIPAGFVAPIHAHTGDYYGMNVKGNWRHSFDGGEEKDLPQGSYVLQPGMGWHGDACIGPEDCILFIHQHVKGDFIPKQ